MRGHPVPYGDVLATMRHRWTGARAGDARWLAAALVAGVVLALFVARQPFLAAGAMGGGLVLVALLLRPVLLLGVTLAVGAVNLAILTGGERQLLSAMGGLDMNGIRLAGIVLGFGALLLVDRRMLEEAFGRHGRLYLLFLGYAAATLAVSASMGEGLRLLFKLAYPFMIYLAVRALVRDEGQLSRLGDWVLMAAALLILVVNPLLVLGGGYTVDGSGHVRIQGLGLHQNPFSYYLLAMLFLAVARYMFRSQLRYLLLALVLGGWIVLTMTRISLLASLLGLGGMAIYVAVKRRNAKPLLIATAVALAIAIPLTPLVLDRTVGFVPTPGEVASYVTDPGALAGAMRWGGREHIWPVLVGAFRSSPVLGLGLGSSGPVIRGSFASAVSDIPHNEYLRIVVDTGLLGLGLLGLALVVWWGSAAAAGLRAEGVSREYGAAAVAVGLAAVVIALTGNPIDYYAQFTQYVAFFCAAAVAARPGGEAAPTPGPDPAMPAGHGSGQ
jgi:O-antigen ligase